MSFPELDSDVVPVLRGRIFDVLKQSDLTTVSAKKIRIALAELPEGSLPSGVDLSEQKKAIDAEIRKCYDEVTRPGGPKKAKKSASAEEKKTKAPSKPRAPKKTAADAPKKTATKRGAKDKDGEEPNKKRAPNPNSPLNRPMRLSPEMAEVCGGSEMPRHGVVKQLWAYIKDKNLQNETNKRQVLKRANPDPVRFKIIQFVRQRQRRFLRDGQSTPLLLTQLIGPHLEKIQPPT
ncbi:hypothetical protein MYAM1_000999 [Malassezia yamatoensis]|uniref:DM2 domain-containing protein n=1 Tax=Malassezia yamatoensis TaxID=253288 RepID=A0AAJ5YXI2_9BASI|nr:hypothetical protein MYAM1_000999 [Malassezia yamatoensis]